MIVFEAPLPRMVNTRLAATSSKARHHAWPRGGSAARLLRPAHWARALCARSHWIQLTARAPSAASLALHAAWRWRAQRAQGVLILRAQRPNLLVALDLSQQPLNLALRL
jgi:hypothetical protein